MSKQNGNGRTFEDSPAVRKQLPCFVGLTGISSSGKTYSALRLAAGMQRVTGGEVFGIDTESNRMLQYANKFKFRHVPFKPPFSPDDYAAVWRHCVSKGAKVIIVDSMTHEHSGLGGVLEMHEAELERMAGNDYDKRKRVQGFAWGPPKKARRRLIEEMMSWNGCAIFCWRGQEKLDWKNKNAKGEPTELGWMPITTSDFVWEMTVNAIFTPGCDGVPDWQLDRQGEGMIKKVPEFFRSLFSRSDQLSEAHGEAMAKWSAGDAAPTSAQATNGNSKPAPAPNTFRDRIKWPGAADWTGRALSDGTADALSAYRGALVLLHEEAKNDRQRNGIALHLDEVNRAIVDAESGDFGDDEERAAIEADEARQADADAEGA